MADDTTSWTVKMEDDVSGAAKSAADALAKLDDQIARDTKALAGMQKAMRNLQGGSSVNIDQFRKLNGQILATKGSLAKAQSESLALGGSFNTTKKSSGGLVEKLKAVIDKQAEIRPPEKVDAFAKQLDGLSRQAGAMPGPIGGIVSALGKMRTVIGGGVIAAGLLAIVAALVALTVAAFAAARALYNYGKAQADARRSELLRLEGLTKLRFMYQRVAGNAKEMQAALDKTAASSPSSRGELARYEERLYRMGLRGANLTKVMEGVGIKLAVQGEEAANAFAGWAAGANMSGQGVDRLVNRVKRDLGGTAAKMMASSEVQAQKLKESFDALFSGVEIERYLFAWKEVNDVLSQNTATGRGLKLLMTSILQPFYDASAKGAPLVKRFFQGMVIAALELAIVVVKLQRVFKNVFGDPSLFEGIDWGWLLVISGKAVVWGLGIAILSIVKPIMWFIAAFNILFAVGETFGEVLFDLVDGLVSLWKRLDPVNATMRFFGDEISKVWAKIKMLGSVLRDFLPAALKYLADLFMEGVGMWIDLGKSIILGIVEGLSIGPFIDKMKEIAIGGVKAFKSALEIESPSKVFMRVGREIPAGVAEGVDDGALEAQSATQRMVDGSVTIPKLGKASSGGGASEGAAAGAANGGKSAGGKSVTIEQLNVYAQSSDPKGIAQDIRRELESVLEGLSLEIGAPVPT